MSKKDRERKRRRMDEKIRAAWEMFEAAEPDISTERLYAMVGDYCGVDAGRVSDAIPSTPTTDL